jgi:hypothetical protein
MRHVGLLFALCAMAAPALAQTVTVRPAPPKPLQCEVGPVSKTFGRTQWLVYGCADNRSLVVLAAPGNPANPFYFLFSPGESGYRITGEGTGRQSATRAAFAELETLTDQDIAALLEETRQR